MAVGRSSRSYRPRGAVGSRRQGHDRRPPAATSNTHATATPGTMPSPWRRNPSADPAALNGPEASWKHRLEGGRGGSPRRARTAAARGTSATYNDARGCPQVASPRRVIRAPARLGANAATATPGARPARPPPASRCRCWRRHWPGSRPGVEGSPWWPITPCRPLPGRAGMAYRRVTGSPEIR